MAIGLTRARVVDTTSFESKVLILYGPLVGSRWISRYSGGNGRHGNFFIVTDRVADGIDGWASDWGCYGALLHVST